MSTQYKTKSYYNLVNTEYYVVTQLTLNIKL